MRRERTERRKRFHKNTHNWTRVRYRKMILGAVEGHVASGDRGRVVSVSLADR